VAWMGLDGFGFRWIGFKLGWSDLDMRGGGGVDEFGWTLLAG